MEETNDSVNLKKMKFYCFGLIKAQRNVWDIGVAEKLLICKSQGQRGPAATLKFPCT